MGKFRAEEVRLGSPKMRFGRSLVKRKHGIDESQTSAPSGKRRVLEGGEAGANKPVGVTITFEDDDDDDDEY